MIDVYRENFFAQFVERLLFYQCIKQRKVNYKVQSFTYLTHYLYLFFAQLIY